MCRVHLFLLVLVLISAAAVITVRHQNRLEFVSLQKQEQEKVELQAEWGRLMLEKATWTRQHNVADSARKQLAMSAPSPDKIITLEIDKVSKDDR